MSISAISLISYDAHYLPSSIAKYYEYVDEIVLGLDESRITWSGNTFTFEEDALWKSLKNIDIDNKISVVEGNFHKSKVYIENDNHERNFLKSHCTKDMIISIEADEQLVNATEFFNNYCPVATRYIKKLDFCMTVLVTYKLIDDTILVVANEDDSLFVGNIQGILTHKQNTYTDARRTSLSDSGKNRLLSPLLAIPCSTCSTKEELYQKISNTSPANINSSDSFFSTWDSITLDNYQQLRNFDTFGLSTMRGPKLLAVPKDRLEDYIQHTERAK
jgi:hypothetical protein